MVTGPHFRLGRCARGEEFPTDREKPALADVFGKPPVEDRQ